MKRFDFLLLLGAKLRSQPPDRAHRQQARQAVLRCFDAQAHAQAWTDLIRSTAERVRGLTQIKGCGLI